MRIGEEKIQHLLNISEPALPISELLIQFDDNLIDMVAIDPIESAEIANLKEDIQQALSILSEREHQVLEMRYGLINGEVSTLEEVGHDYNVTRERIRQIESKALRELRHSSYCDNLHEYFL